LSDEVSLKWIARPAKGWTTRLTSSSIQADKTGLVSEPEQADVLKAMLSYAAPAGWMVSGFYDYKNSRNGNHVFADAAGTPVWTQNTDSTLHSAGLSLSAMPRDNVNVQMNLYRVQSDFSSYLFTTNVQRWNPAVAFALADNPEYRVDTRVFSLGGDWRVSDKIGLSGSYTLSESKGDVASGLVLTQLQTATGTIDSLIDNTLHSFSLGLEYRPSDKTTLRLRYTYDDYEDSAYELLSGGVNTVVIGVCFAM
jgi:hypothetical protein